MASSFQQQWFGEAQPHCVGMKEEGSAYWNKFQLFYHGHKFDTWQYKMDVLV
jgi:hypothetical protein